MGTSFSKKVNDKNKASRAALQVPAKESSDYIPFLPTARIEEYVYCKKSKITNSGRVYETEKYDFYHNLSDKMTNGLDQYKLKEIKFEDFETVNSNPLDISNNGLVKITMGMEEWKRKTRRVQGPYSDQKFIPSESSVLGNQSVDGNNLRVVFKYPYIVWDRPFMYSLRKMKNIQNWEKFRKSGQKNDKITFFRDDKLSFTDVYQGVLPNSHFFSALIVIAKSSQDIEGSIFHQKTDMRGVFGFLFNLKAKWTIISVDDNIPFFKRTMALEDLKERNPGKKVTPRFRLDFLSARAETKLLWPLLMEKAYAKTAGSYMNLAMSSDAGLVLTDLTGCPTEMKEMQDLPSSDILWQELTRASQKGHKICALSIDNEECQKIFQNEFNQFRKNVNNRVYGDFPYKIGQDDFMVEYLGMFPNQVYPILSIKDDQRGRSIVTLDPRGRLKYKSNINSGAGKTSNYCNHQSKLLRGKDRLFKIPLSDFSKLFSKIYICYCQPNLMSTTVTANFNGNTFSCFRLKFDSPGDYYIRVSQESHLRKPGEARVKYDVIQILLAKVNEYNEYEFIEGKIEGFRDVWMRVEDIEADSDYNLYVNFLVTKLKGESKLRKEEETRHVLHGVRECDGRKAHALPL